MNEKITQLDTNYAIYYQNKRHNKKNAFSRYVQDQLDIGLTYSVTEFIIKTICDEWPECFAWEPGEITSTLTNHLTTETLAFDTANLTLLSSSIEVYQNGLDALLSQIPEDLSIIECDASFDKIRYLHLCSPNFWSAEEKIGNSFITAHEAVPGMEKINDNHSALNELLKTSGPFQRFTWGLTTNRYLNQHPKKRNRLNARLFDDFNQIFLRVERQVTVPFYKHNAYLFFIRTYVTSIKDLSKTEKLILIKAVESMPSEITLYKGLAGKQETIINNLSR